MHTNGKRAEKGEQGLTDLFNNTKPVTLFSATHLCFLALSALFCSVMILFGRRLNDKKRHTLLVILWAVFTVIELGKYVYFVLYPDEFDIRTGLPLHLCSVSLFTYPLAVFTKNETFRNFIYAVNLPGAFFALVTPDIGNSTAFSFYFLHLMVAHTFIVLIPLYMVLTGMFRPDMRRLPSVALMLGLLMLPVTAVNRLLDSNYFFINGPVRGTLTQTFADWLGEEYYLLPMFAALLAVWGVLYLPFDLAALSHHHKERIPSN